MGVGKSTLGKIIAKKLNLEFIDTDRNIEKKCLMKIVQIFNEKGEDFFRQKEEGEVLKSLEKNNCIIALGGGAFINNVIRENILKTSISIWLDDDLEVLNKRTKNNKKRPLLNMKNSKKEINKLYNFRKDIYNLANYKIDCRKESKSSIIKKIISVYEKH